MPIALRFRFGSTSQFLMTITITSCVYVGVMVIVIRNGLVEPNLNLYIYI